MLLRTNGTVVGGQAALQLIDRKYRSPHTVLDIYTVNHSASCVKAFFLGIGYVSPPKDFATNKFSISNQYIARTILLVLKTAGRVVRINLSRDSRTAVLPIFAVR